MKMKNKMAFIVFASIILTSCGGVDLKNEKSVKNWLDGKSLFIEGKLIFSKDGSFSLKPQNSNDPTQNYTGTWELGSFRTQSDGSGAMRDITIRFNTTGYITDGNSYNGTNFSGFGKVITGFISKGASNYEFTSENTNSGLEWDRDKSSYKEGSKYWTRKFE